jgi:hypothetical protein
VSSPLLSLHRYPKINTIHYRHWDSIRPGRGQRELLIEPIRTDGGLRSGEGHEKLPAPYARSYFQYLVT